MTTNAFIELLKSVNWGGEKLENGLTVGGSLYLSGTNITSLPDGLTVGDSLDLSGTKIPMNKRRNYRKLSHGNKTSKWIYADGILTHIKTVKTVNDVTLYISPYSTVVVTKDHQTFAHGKDIRSAIRDLQFKTAERDIEQYRNMGLDTPIAFDEAVIMYRVITGACSYGTQRFLDEHPELANRKTITIKEMMGVTKQEYGLETFARYFEGEK